MKASEEEFDETSRLRTENDQLSALLLETPIKTPPAGFFGAFSNLFKKKRNDPSSSKSIHRSRSMEDIDLDATVSRLDVDPPAMVEPTTTQNVPGLQSIFGEETIKSINLEYPQKYKSSDDFLSSSEMMKQASKIVKALTKSTE